MLPGEAEFLSSHASPEFMLSRWKTVMARLRSSIFR